MHSDLRRSRYLRLTNKNGDHSLGWDGASALIGSRLQKWMFDDGAANAFHTFSAQSRVAFD
jgi:hypothetical protein